MFRRTLSQVNSGLKSLQHHRHRAARAKLQAGRQSDDPHHGATEGFPHVLVAWSDTRLTMKSLQSLLDACFGPAAPGLWTWPLLGSTVLGRGRGQAEGNASRATKRTSLRIEQVMYRTHSLARSEPEGHGPCWSAQWQRPPACMPGAIRAKQRSDIVFVGAESLCGCVSWPVWSQRRWQRDAEPSACVPRVVNAKQRGYPALTQELCLLDTFFGRVGATGVGMAVAGQRSATAAGVHAQGG